MILNGNGILINENLLSKYLNEKGRVETYFAFHLHTHYSLLDGFSEPKEYMEVAKNLGISGLGITEHGNLFSAPYFELLKKDYPSVKVVYGTEAYESFDMYVKDKDNKYFHLVILARNERGRIAINEIITKSNQDGFYYKPRVDLKLLESYAKDLIFTSACLASKLSREDDFNKVVEYVNEYKSVMPYFYLEMQSHLSEDQVKYNKKILELSKVTNTPFVITMDAHASTKQELEYQSYFVKIAKDSDTASEIYEGCYIQSVDEIYERMSPQIGEENVTIGLLNTLGIMELTEDVKMPFQKPELPIFETGSVSQDDYLLDKVWEGFEKRGLNKKENVQEYKDRIEYEMSIISSMGFSGYFLITWDWIKYSRDNGIIIGNGRGSGAASLVAYCLWITNVDPIKYELIFERFLNPERNGEPDFDTDVSDQEFVINYLESKYGSEQVSRVVNFSYITPKVAIKDVGDVLGIPYKVRDEISKLFPSDNFEEDYNNSKSRLEKYVLDNPEYTKWFEVARAISGKVRQTSIHACAVGIVNTKITDYMPVHLGENGEKIIQVDKKILEKIGIVKMDVLGLKTLKVVSNALNYLGRSYDYIDINDDNFISDEKTYQLIESGNTEGVFQMESYGMKELFKKLNCRSILEISDGISLYRPDTMDVLDEYILVKKGLANPTYIHDDMIPIFEKTNGQMVYQEQLLNVVRKFGGRSYGGADIFRRAIGKKDRDLVISESTLFRKEVSENNYSPEIADKLFDIMVLKGNYSFNLPHGVCYATLAYKTAYLKANHPVEFMTALLNSEIGNFGKISKYINNCKFMGIEVLPPNINKSSNEFTISDGKILFGLSMIKGIGESASQDILTAREGGKFKSFEDMIERTTINKSAVISLIKSGALGGKKTELLKTYCDSTFDNKEFTPLKTTSGYTVEKLKTELGIDTKDKEERLLLFNEFKEKEFIKSQQEKLKTHRLDFKEKYMYNKGKWEFDTLSIYLTNNPLEDGLKLIRPFDEYEDGDRVTTIGTIIKIDKKKGKSGAYAFIEFYDGDTVRELIMWSNVYKKYDTKLKRGIDLVVIGRKEGENIVAEKAKPYATWKKEKGLV